VKRTAKIDPVQEWGEEEEEGAVFGITLRREPVLPGPDSPEPPTAFSFVQYHTVKVRRLKAATLERLITHLLDPEHQEPDFVPVFLSTYRAFTSAINTTISEAVVTPPPRPTYDTLLPVVRRWLDKHSEDLNEPPQYPTLRLLCVHLQRRLCFRRLSQAAEAMLKKFQEQGREDVRSGIKRADESLQQELADQQDGGEPRPFSFMDFSVRDVAEQLTRLDAELFVRVVPFHCTGCVWSQRDKKENRNLAPTVRATISQFNAVTNRVITSLLSDCVCVCVCARAQECRELKNFSSLRAILSALQSNAVYRLKKTWAAVSRSESLLIFPDENCVLISREILAEVNPSSKCLHFITSSLRLDFCCFRPQEFEILSQIQQLQASCSHYSLPVRPHITAWLQAHTLLTDQESYELSRELEPPRRCGSPHTSFSGSLHNVAEDFCSMSSSSPSLSSSSCSSSHPDLSSSSLLLSSESSSPSPSSGCSPQASLPLYNKQVADLCIIRVSVESVSNGNVYKSILLTSQDHTPQVIQRALEKHNMEDVRCHDFSLFQKLHSGKGENVLQIPDKANVFYAMCTSANYDFVLRQRWRSHGRQLASSSSPGAQPRNRHAK
uniref:Ral guanine nucleotide dissociation stimulator-like 3a n=1 Tax=Salarias fasciatus TaxID=181472 RepID=A0A672IT25_SALFA